jgi:hypothetical protein
MAPEKITMRECRIAMIAAMKNVLSPSSETRMTESEAANACENSGLKMLKTPPAGAVMAVAVATAMVVGARGVKSFGLLLGWPQ